jgi:gliding motility-associated lipoprotein GldD
MIRLTILSFVFAFVFAGCQDTPAKPKPRAYPRIEFPEQTYQEYNQPSCPFTFQFPSYANIELKDQPCWFNIELPAFNAKIHCSYTSVASRAQHDDLVKDAFIIADKINARANYMEQLPIRNKHGVAGLALHWTGPAASPVHFFLTDTTNHFFTAALYFDSKVQPDSLAPMVTFIQKDIDQMIATFSWKK